MGRAPCCSKVGLHRGPWTPKEDSLLVDYIRVHGEGDWRALPKKAGLLRCGKSCRLRWMNYLRPDIKRGNITPDEDDLIIRLHALLGNRWSLIAGRLPGRTDNEIKNYWNTHLAKKLKSQGTDPGTHKKLLGLGPARPTKKKRPSKPKPSDNNAAAVVVHQPKPVRVTALSLKRNDSNASFESNVTSEFTPASDGSDGAAAAYWKDGMITMMMEEGAADDDDQGAVEFLIGSSEGDEGMQGFMVEPRASDQGMLDKLYEEYLQLIKVDDDDGLIGLEVEDDDQSLELDSFAESLLI